MFVDYNGLTRARSVSISALPEMLARGVNFSSPTVDFNSRDLFPPSPAFDLASPDFWARPDPATYRPVPWSTQTGQMLSDLVRADGTQWEGCPRTALRRVVELGVARGLRFNVGFEPEGYALRQNGSDLDFAGMPQFATADGLEIESEFMEELLQALGAVGLSVAQWSEEFGPGQIEVNLHYDAPLEAADNLVFFKHTFRSIARRHGLLGTFMPKPYGDQAGSGLHVHLSATPVHDPCVNLLDDPGDEELALSQWGRHALGGILEHGEALTALGATTVNSYKRLLPGSWSPTHIMYAYASRAAFVRIPERETPRRLELRVGDAAGNPYLYLTGILAAMLHGIERQIDPGPPVPGNVGAFTPEEAASRGARLVPHTLAGALECLAGDQVMSEALGPLILDEFLKVKWSEWEDFCRHVGEWDRSWYLGRY